jgi:hypothetical protein
MHVSRPYTAIWFVAVPMILSHLKQQLSRHNEEMPKEDATQPRTVNYAKELWK